MKLSRRPTSRPTTLPITLDDIEPFLKTIQRQHKITLRRLNNIQRQLDAYPEGEPEAKDAAGGWKLVRWFRKLVGLSDGR